MSGNKFDVLNEVCVRRLSVRDRDFQQIQPFNKRRFFPYYGFIKMDRFVSGYKNPAFYMFSANDDPVAMSVLYNDQYEPMSTRIWIKMINELQESSVVVDCGSHTGFFSFLAAHARKDIRVLSFEPVQSIYERLRLNIRVNSFSDIVTPFQMALGVNAGELDFWVPVHSDGLLPTGSSDAAKVGSAKAALDKQKVSVSSLDLIAQANEIDPSKIGLIKIDAEGGEIDVLKGMEGVFAKAKPNLIIEILSVSMSRDVNYYMAKWGYQSAAIREGAMIIDNKLPKDGSFGGNFLFSTKLDSLVGKAGF